MAKENWKNLVFLKNWKNLVFLKFIIVYLHKFDGTKS